VLYPFHCSLVNNFTNFCLKCAVTLLRSLEVIGHGTDSKWLSKNWAVPGYAHAPFSPNVLMGFCSELAR